MVHSAVCVVGVVCCLVVHEELDVGEALTQFNLNQAGRGRVERRGGRRGWKGVRGGDGGVGGE